MQKYFNRIDLSGLDQRFRANLINSVGGFKSLCLIGTADKECQTNLAIFNSIVHLGATPPLMAFIVRPDTVERHTLNNILETGVYTVNHVSESFYQKAHQTSARYKKSQSEFNETGITAEWKADFHAPFAQQSSIQMGLEFRQRIDLLINQTVLIIGEIQHLFFPDNCLCTDGFLDIEKAGTITCSGLDSYHKTNRIQRLSYAKPDKLTLPVPLEYQKEG
jgi:flavin reductase (DIM6/NTAB) family NADH-FMN oxidoreductase RutF